MQTQKPLVYSRVDILRKLPVLIDKTILDLGAGFGCDFSLSYIDCVHGTNYSNRNSTEPLRLSDEYTERVVALDSNFRSSRETSLPGVSVCSNTKELPFPNKFFDIVAAGHLLDVLETKDREFTLKESARVLKPKGYFIGDVRLYTHKWMWIEDSTDIRRFLMNEHVEQIEEYKRNLQESKLELVNSGIGILTDLYTRFGCLTFYFLAQKNSATFNLR